MSAKTSILLALAFAVATTAAPAFAQVAADKDPNAHPLGASTRFLSTRSLAASSASRGYPNMTKIWP